MSKITLTEEKEVQTDTDTESDRDAVLKSDKPFKVVHYEKSSIGNKFNPIKMGEVPFRNEFILYVCTYRS